MLVSDFSSYMSGEMIGRVAILKALVVHEIALLLHVVRDKYVWHKNCFATSLILLFLQLFLSTLRHFLLGLCIESSLFVQVVAFTFF